MGFNINFNLKDREIKLIYIVIILLVVFGTFKLLNVFLTEKAIAKQELNQIKLEKERILLTLYEAQEINAKNDLLELKLNRLKDQFVVKSEDAAYIMSYGHTDEIQIKSVIPNEIADNNYYYTIVYTIELEGTYLDIIDFIYRLEQKTASKITAMDLKLNKEDMNVLGSIVWEIYSLYEKKTSSTSAPKPVLENGRKDPFQVPREYIGFLHDSVHEEITKQMIKEDKNSQEIVSENNFENNNEIEFLYKSIYNFPIKQ